MNRSAVKWLYEQLPDLVAKRVISTETAERIRGYYGPLPQGLGRRTLMVSFGLIGALLVGLGIMLIIGHNWDRLDHLTRLFISLGVLVTAQVAAGLVLWRKKEDASWLEEGTAVFLTLAIGASIALVGQTYHLVDDFNNYILVWMLLTLPLVYLMDAKGVAGLYLFGVVIWTTSVEYHGSMQYWAWMLMALILPYYGKLLKNGRYANPTVLLSWLLVFTVLSCFYLTGNKRLWELLYASLLSCISFVGLIWFGEAERAWQRPFQTVGLLGGMGLSYFLSFKWPWVAFTYRWAYPVSQAEYLLISGLFVLAIFFGLLLMKRGLTTSIPLGMYPAVIGGGYLLQTVNRNGTYAAAILVNLYLLWISVGFILRGVRETRLGSLNTGMLMLGVLILFRFFDFSYSFYVRGIVFILLGAVFLAVNLIMSRRKDGVQG